MDEKRTVAAFFAGLILLAAALYDTIGRCYARQRREDPRIAACLTEALGAARSVLNVGAGAGSYEPADRFVVALEPSAVMLAQRPPHAAPAVRGRAEALPFADGAFDAVMAILTIHHWTDRAAGLAECARVAHRRVVVFTWDPEADAFWLLKDYFPELVEVDRRQMPPLPAYADLFDSAFDVRIAPVPVPPDCIDGLLGAYWARAEAYPDPTVRAGISLFARAGVDAGLERLRADLASGAWDARHAASRTADQLVLGYRLVVAEHTVRKG